MKYDDASWHYGADFPSDSPKEFGGTHIALFLKYCFIKGWASKTHLQNAGDEVKRVIDGSMPATEFLFKHCDGKLTDEDLNDTGNKFALQYYETDGKFFEDYVEWFDDLMYVSSEKAHSFSQFHELLDVRVQEYGLS